MTRTIAPVGIVVLVLLTGCLAAAPAEYPDDDNQLGYEAGYSATDQLAVTTSDGLNASERAAVTARAMARLEVLRDLEFHKPVTTRVISRAQYLDNRSGGSNPTHVAWNGQVWEALFLVGEDANVSSVLDTALGARVIGFYVPGSNEVVIVSDSASPEISRGTLVHELVHALQDQHFGLDQRRSTQDGQLARNGVVEGEANRLQGLYERRCGRTWECVRTPGGGGGESSLGRWAENVFSVIFTPYAAGPRFVDAIAERRGNEGLNDLYTALPESTEQIIHPQAYPDERPIDVEIPDRSNDQWHRFDHDPVADTVGEASIFVTMVANDIGPGVARYGYEHPASVGWGGDSVVPYRNGDRFGYVWTTVWDTPNDAEEFLDAHRRILDGENAAELDGGR
ncbi:MAG: Hvo_1808 family surface protein, partial [Salinirussus sp.]